MGGGNSISVRDPVERDLEALTAIYNHYVRTTAITFDTEEWSVARRKTEWFDHYGATGPHRLLVAADEHDDPLGYATSGSFRPKGAYSTTVAVSIYCAPDAIGHGIGTTLYAALFDAIKDDDLHRAMAGITLPNDASVALHRRFGFTDIGVEHEVGRKFGRYWDVLLMERPLP